MPSRDLVGKPEGKKPLGKLGLRWEESIKINLQKVGWGGMEWIALAQDMGRWQAVVNVIMNLAVSIKCGEFFDNPRTCWLLRKDSAPWSLFVM